MEPYGPQGRVVLIACEMLRDEIEEILERRRPVLEVDWVDTGYHEYPDKLRAFLQGRIDAAQACRFDTILLGFGLCGNGAVGLSAQHARLAIPRFDDCVNMVLCTGVRTKRALCEGGVMYVTKGWSKDESTNITGQHRRVAEKYGQRKASRVIEMMYGGYHCVSVIDDGCYEVEPVRAFAQRSADLLGVGLRTEPGSNAVLETLICGPWDENIIAVDPGHAIKQEDFECNYVTDRK